MNPSNDIILLTIFLTLASISLLAIVILFFRLIRLKKDYEAHKLKTQSAYESIIEMGKRVAALHNEVAALVDKRQSQVEMNPTYKAYSQAAEMIQNGVPVAEVMKKCQLSKGEAELLSAMTNKQNM